MPVRLLALLAFIGAVLGETASQQKIVFDPEKMKATVQRLEQPIPFEFVEAPIQDVMDFISDSQGVKFIWGAESVRDKPVSLSLNNVALGHGLQKLLDAHNLTYAVRPNGDVLVVPVDAVGKKTRDQPKKKTRTQ